MADAAIGPQTDPDPNDAAEPGYAFAASGIILRVRIAGGSETVERYVRQIRRSGLKLIVATYCKTPEEQKEAYRTVHRICQS